MIMMVVIIIINIIIIITFLSTLINLLYSRQIFSSPLLSIFFKLFLIYKNKQLNSSIRKRCVSTYRKGIPLHIG